MFKKLLVVLSIVLSSAASAEIFEAWDFSAIEGDCTSSKDMAPIGPFFKRHFLSATSPV